MDPRATHSHAEREHREDTGSGLLRATLFGVSDGLVSNLALVMGVAGGSEQASAVVLAGSAGLLAGAFSMAAGEYASMQTQREAMERELDVERDHIARFPEEEEAHLAKILGDAGLPPDDARRMASRIHEDIDLSVEFHARHELGIVPDQMGWPVRAALASFFSFVLGAAVPLIPWMLLEDALLPSLLASFLALAGVGAAATRFTGVHPLRGGVRQLLIGSCAAAITFAVGNIVGRAL